MNSSQPKTQRIFRPAEFLFLRFLSALLIISIALPPSSAYALRSLSAVESGAEEELTQSLKPSALSDNGLAGEIREEILRETAFLRVVNTGNSPSWFTDIETEYVRQHPDQRPADPTPPWMHLVEGADRQVWVHLHLFSDRADPNSLMNGLLVELREDASDSASPRLQPGRILIEPSTHSQVRRFFLDIEGDPANNLPPVFDELIRSALQHEITEMLNRPAYGFRKSFTRFQTERKTLFVIAASINSDQPGLYMMLRRKTADRPGPQLEWMAQSGPYFVFGDRQRDVIFRRLDQPEDLPAKRQILNQLGEGAGQEERKEFSSRQKQWARVGLGLLGALVISVGTMGGWPLGLKIARTWERSPAALSKNKDYKHEDLQKLAEDVPAPLINARLQVRPEDESKVSGWTQYGAKTENPYLFDIEIPAGQANATVRIQLVLPDGTAPRTHIYDGIRVSQGMYSIYSENVQWNIVAVDKDNKTRIPISEQALNLAELSSAGYFYSADHPEWENIGSFELELTVGRPPWWNDLSKASSTRIIIGSAKVVRTLQYQKAQTAQRAFQILFSLLGFSATAVPVWWLYRSLKEKKPEAGQEEQKELSPTQKRWAKVGFGLLGLTLVSLTTLGGAGGGLQLARNTEYDPVERRSVVSAPPGKIIEPVAAIAPDPTNDTRWPEVDASLEVVPSDREKVRNWRLFSEPDPDQPQLFTDKPGPTGFIEKGGWISGYDFTLEIPAGQSSVTIRTKASLPDGSPLDSRVYGDLYTGVYPDPQMPVQMSAVSSDQTFEKKYRAAYVAQNTLTVLYIQEDPAWEQVHSVELEWTFNRPAGSDLSKPFSAQVHMDTLHAARDEKYKTIQERRSWRNFSYGLAGALLGFTISAGAAYWLYRSLREKKPEAGQEEKVVSNVQFPSGLEPGAKDAIHAAILELNRSVQSNLTLVNTVANFRVRLNSAVTAFTRPLSTEESDLLKTITHTTNANQLRPAGDRDALLRYLENASVVPSAGLEERGSVPVARGTLDGRLLRLPAGWLNLNGKRKVVVQRIDRDETTGPHLEIVTLDEFARRKRRVHSHIQLGFRGLPHAQQHLKAAFDQTYYIAALKKGGIVEISEEYLAHAGVVPSGDLVLIDPPNHIEFWNAEAAAARFQALSSVRVYEKPAIQSELQKLVAVMENLLGARNDRDVAEALYDAVAALGYSGFAMYLVRPSAGGQYDIRNVYRNLPRESSAADWKPAQDEIAYALASNEPDLFIDRLDNTADVFPHVSQSFFTRDANEYGGGDKNRVRQVYYLVVRDPVTREPRMLIHLNRWAVNEPVFSRGTAEEQRQFQTHLRGVLESLGYAALLARENVHSYERADIFNRLGARRSIIGNRLHNDVKNSLVFVPTFIELLGQRENLILEEMTNLNRNVAELMAEVIETMGRVENPGVSSQQNGSAAPPTEPLVSADDLALLEALFHDLSAQLLNAVRQDMDAEDMRTRILKPVRDRFSASRSAQAVLDRWEQLASTASMVVYELQQERVDFLRRIPVLRQRFLELKTHEAQLRTAAGRLDNLEAQKKISMIISGTIRARRSMLRILDELEHALSDDLTVSELPPPYSDQVDLVSELREIIETRSGLMQLHFSSDLPAALRVPDARGDLVSGMLGELLVNAYKNRRPDVPLEVWVSVQYQESSGMIDLTVRDNGAGIPLAKRAQIFERGATNGTSSAGVSRGLGLATREELQKLGGGIELAESVHAGDANAAQPGSTFHFWLPTNPSAGAEEKKSEYVLSRGQRITLWFASATLGFVLTGLGTVIGAGAGYHAAETYYRADETKKPAVSPPESDARNYPWMVGGGLAGLVGSIGAIRREISSGRDKRSAGLEEKIVVRVNDQGQPILSREGLAGRIPGYGKTVVVQPPAERLAEISAVLSGKFSNLETLLVQAYQSKADPIDISAIKQAISQLNPESQVFRLSDTMSLVQFIGWVESLNISYFHQIGVHLLLRQTVEGERIWARYQFGGAQNWEQIPYLNGIIYLNQGTVDRELPFEWAGTHPANSAYALMDLEAVRLSDQKQAERYRQGGWSVLEKQLLIDRIYLAMEESQRRLAEERSAFLEETRHAQDALWASFYHGVDVRLINQANLLVADALVRPDSLIDKVWSLGKGKYQVRQTQKNLEALSARADAISELAGNMGSLRQQMNELILDGKDQQAFLIFALDFVRQMRAVNQGHSNTADLFTAYMYQKAISASLGIQEPTEILMSFMRQPSPGRAAYEWVDQFYRRNFWTDEERVALLEGKSIAEVLAASAGAEELQARQRMTVLDEAAPQGAGVLVIEARAFANRGGLEEFIGRIGALKTRIVLFGSDSAAIKELALRNGVSVVDSDDPADLAFRLAGMEERANRIGYVGNSETAGLLARILPASMVVIPLGSPTLEKMMLFLGYPSAVLNSINAAGFEEQLAASTAA